MFAGVQIKGPGVGVNGVADYQRSGSVAGGFAPLPLGEFLSYLSLSKHFPDFMRGIVDTKAIVYYLSITALFLYMAIRSIETGRWR